MRKMNSLSWILGTPPVGTFTTSTFGANPKKAKQLAFS
jgi:hypothetical protein